MPLADYVAHGRRLSGQEILGREDSPGLRRLPKLNATDQVRIAAWIGVGVRRWLDNDHSQHGRYHGDRQHLAGSWGLLQVQERDPGWSFESCADFEDFFFLFPVT